jgi:histidinol dehydrogenase
MPTQELSGMPDGVKAHLLQRAGVDLSDKMALAKRVVDRVRAGGDRALLECAREYDGFVGDGISVTRADLRAAKSRLPEDLLQALATCKARIEEFHSRQIISPFEYRDRAGVFGQKVVPLESIGAYVPGGTASYASSVLMACVPARVAGVDRIALFSPAKGGKIGDAVLAAAEMCGVSEVYSVGGAQAISAMAYGTETIMPVQKIVGPGGAIVSAAKLLVRNDCEIDSLAGPSEILLVADGRADAITLAAEMLAQLEHDVLARAVLVSTSSRLLASVEEALQSMASSAGRRDIVERSIADGASFLLAGNMAEAVRFVNEYAPEHLYIDVTSPEAMLGSVRNAGSVFLGRHSSVAFGDYCAGPNHILPTMGTARARSSLSTFDFVKIIPYQAISPAGASSLAPVVELMASAEGLPGHASAAALRLGVTK